MDTKELDRLVTALFTRGRHRTRVAVEQEFITTDLTTGLPPAIDLVRRTAGPALAAPYLGFEPGGQIELSLPCTSGAAELTQQLCLMTADLQIHLGAAGIRLDAIPCDPRPDVPLQLTSPRYTAMQRHFDTIGPAGRRMMRRTASTQVCLDWWPGAAGLEQWRLLNLAGPFLAAAFARSSGPDGRLTTWLHVDPDRTAFDNRLLLADPSTEAGARLARDLEHRHPAAAYAAFAAGATAFTPTPAEHLTTLFPPLRPRTTYLEVRFLDAQEPAEVGRVVTTLENLMYDDDRRRRTLRALEPELPHLADHWRAAAAGDQGIAEHGEQLVPKLELVA